MPVTVGFAIVGLGCFFLGIVAACAALSKDVVGEFTVQGINKADGIVTYGFRARPNMAAKLMRRKYVLVHVDNAIKAESNMGNGPVQKEE